MITVDELQKAKDLLVATEEAWESTKPDTVPTKLFTWGQVCDMRESLAAMVALVERHRKAERIALVGDMEWAVCRSWIPEPVFREWVQARLELEGWSHISAVNVRQISDGKIEPDPDNEDTYFFYGGKLPMTICDLEELPA